MRCVREFDWDDEKEAANVHKHVISFDEARSSNAASVDSSRPPGRAGAQFRTGSASGASLFVEAH
jgi:hypothetical protein